MRRLIMKLTNQEIINLINALNDLSQKDLPITIAYKIIGNVEKLMNVYATYEKTKEKVKTDQELLELLEIENDIDLELIEKQELIDAGITISPAQLVGISEIING